MSANATAWAWSHDLPSTVKLILLALADVADGNDCVAVQRVDIERTTNLSETTVRTAINTLVGDGYMLKVDDVVRRDQTGQNALVPLYQLQLGRRAEVSEK